MIKKQCETCNKEFITFPCAVKEGCGRFCSRKCFEIYKDKTTKETIKCLYCGIEFRGMKIKKRKYCSDKCYSSAKKGIKLPPRSKKHCANISKANKGRSAWNKGLKGFLGEEKHYHWKNGIRKSKRGYVRIYSPTHPNREKHNNDVPEHRLIMEKQLGRYLTPREVVHHINGIKSDNRLENLMALTNNGVHNRVENNCSVKPEEIIFDGRKLSH